MLIATGTVYLKYNSLHRAVNISHKHIIQVLVPVNVIQSLGSIAQRSLQSLYKGSKADVEISAQLAAEDDLA